ncbi:MAG: sulfur carrier protein ThiS [Acidobacteriota bacterium]
MSEQNIIEVTVNGEARQITTGSSVTDLITLLELTAGRLAIELNLSILPRAAWTETALVAGDKLEIVHFVGGG